MKAVMKFPRDYVVVDLETTGLSPEYDSIIEVCAMKFIDGKDVDKFSTLVNPGFEIPDFITQLTGISSSMVEDAPPIQDVIGGFLDFIKGFPIVGHNVMFDLGFLKAACEHEIDTEIIDTLRIARLLHKERPHNRLKDLAECYGLDYSSAHRADFDCELTNSIFHIFEAEFREVYGDADPETVFPRHTHDSKIARTITTKETDFDESHPFYGKSFCFTGTLDKMLRKEAMQIVVDHGGFVGDSVTQKTNYLVLGNNDYCRSIKGGKSSKQKKAEKLIVAGYDIEIMPEDVFYALIETDETD